MATATVTGQKVGKVVQVIGPVVDVEFAGGELPAIYSAVRIISEAGAPGDGIHAIAEGGQHPGGNPAPTEALKAADGMRPGRKGVDTGAPAPTPRGSRA